MQGLENMRCSICDASLQGWTVYQKVSGWERWREAGGTNALALREPKQEFACQRCIDALKRGVDPKNQVVLPMAEVR